VLMAPQCEELQAIRIPRAQHSSIQWRSDRRCGLVTEASVPMVETTGTWLGMAMLALTCVFESSVRSGPSARFKEGGAVDGAPVGAVGRLESR